MKLRTFEVGPVSCNCVIVACPATNEAAIVDPGGDPEAILAEVSAMGVKVKWILHTHGHFDHILATAAIAKATGAAIALHANDLPLYEKLPDQGRIFGFTAEVPPRPERLLAGGETLGIGTLSAHVIHTPGHTPGSVGYYFGPNHALLLSGDTLFRDSVGRTDLQGGSWSDLESSILERLYVLPDDTRVIPGHGPETTIEHERIENPFVRGLPREAS